MHLYLYLNVKTIISHMQRSKTISIKKKQPVFVEIFYSVVMVYANVLFHLNLISAIQNEYISNVLFDIYEWLSL